MNKYEKNIYGMLMYPSSMNEADHDKVWQSSEFYTDKNFESEYRKHLIAMTHIVECAKIYVNKNWSLINDWSNLNVIITDNTGKSTKYYNHVPRESVGFDPKTLKRKRDIFDDLEKRRKKEHNPIKTLDGVVLDTSDGDFSLTINGKDHLWIDGSSVIVIANYIEKNLV